MARCSGIARLVVTGAALLVLAATSSAAVQREGGDLASASTIDLSSEAEAEVDSQMIEAFVSISKEIKTGRKLQGSVVTAAAAPNVTGVDTAAIQAKVGPGPAAHAAAPVALPLVFGALLPLYPVFWQLYHSLSDGGATSCHECPATCLPAAASFLPACSCCPQVFASALATWQLPMINGHTNKGLKPNKFKSYNLNHCYQVRCIQVAEMWCLVSHKALRQPGCTRPAGSFLCFKQLSDDRAPALPCFPACLTAATTDSRGCHRHGEQQQPCCSCQLQMPAA
jgi:hypothetical protein